MLKQKRLYEGQREQLYNQQFNVEQTAFALQSMQDSVETVQAMKVAGKELKTTLKHKDLRIESIERMQDDLVDMLDMQNEINDILGQTYAVPDDIDEDELLGELDALEGELADELAEGGGAVPAYMQEPELPDMPSAPARPLHEDFDAPSVPVQPQRT